MASTSRQHQPIIDTKLTKLGLKSQANQFIKLTAIIMVMPTVIENYLVTLLTIHKKANRLRLQAQLPIPTLKQAYLLLIKANDV